MTKFIRDHNSVIIQINVMIRMNIRTKKLERKFVMWHKIMLVKN